jgi:hypothetical protein
MKTPVLIKYSFVVFFISFCSFIKNNIKTKESNNKTSNIILESKEKKNTIKEIKYILKENDSVFLYQESYDVNNKHIDSITLKMNNISHLVSFPGLSDFHTDISKNIPKKRIYNYSYDKFLIDAVYPDIVIQYVYNHKENKLENIYVITNTDEVYPDFNRKPTDTISKIKIIPIYKSVIGIDSHLKKISDSIFNSFYESNLSEKIKVYYVLRKEGIKGYLN